MGDDKYTPTQRILKQSTPEATTQEVLNSLHHRCAKDGPEFFTLNRHLIVEIKPMDHARFGGFMTLTGPITDSVAVDTLWTSRYVRGYRYLYNSYGELICKVNIETGELSNNMRVDVQLEPTTIAGRVLNHIRAVASKEDLWIITKENSLNNKQTGKLCVASPIVGVALLGAMELDDSTARSKHVLAAGLHIIRREADLVGLNREDLDAILKKQLKSCLLAVDHILKCARVAMKEERS